MRSDLIERLICPECSCRDLSAFVIDARDDEIVEGVVWCSARRHWFPIDDRLLELLPEPLAYHEDRKAFWKRHAPRLEGLGLARAQPSDAARDVSLQKRQQDHFDDYQANPDQTYTRYEQMSFWQAVDVLIFNEWRSGIGAGSSLLDVGCAQGRSAFKVMDLPIDIVGFDVAKRLVREALDRYKRAQATARATFVVADATRFPFVDCTFDHVLVYGVLHHLVDAERACMEIARVLKPGGTYLGSENNRTLFRAAFDFLQRWQPLWHEEAGSQPLIARRDLVRWFATSGLALEIHTSVFLPPHCLNWLNVASAKNLLAASDHVCGWVPGLRNQGGLIVVKGQRGV